MAYFSNWSSSKNKQSYIEEEKNQLQKPAHCETGQQQHQQEKCTRLWAHTNACMSHTHTHIQVGHLKEMSFER